MLDLIQVTRLRLISFSTYSINPREIQIKLTPPYKYMKLMMKVKILITGRHRNLRLLFLLKYLRPSTPMHVIRQFHTQNICSEEVPLLSISGSPLDFEIKWLSARSLITIETKV